ncbi:unnamed protein product [Larinioides sclopetarius]|uniref:Secreted protein n=1 Tax=Larinioides sclopetarius TaxID=280406 RepID=A0AAV1YXP0_9ARAC
MKMYTAVFVFSVFMSFFSGGILDEVVPDSTRNGAEEAITRLTEFIQVSSPLSVVNISRSPRTGIEASVDNTRSICGVYTPCGWYTYERYTHRLKAWEGSPCDCREGMECASYRDNISISAYEYRCMNVTSSAGRETMVTTVSAMN